MLSSEVNDTLCALFAEPDAPWFGKHFRQRLVADTPADCGQITLNYYDATAFAIGVGIMKGRKHKAIANWNKQGEYAFFVNGHTLILRLYKQAIVTDFDSLGYDPKSKDLFYEGQPLSEGLHEKFQNKQCTLQFNLYTGQDASPLWMERRKALLSYIKTGWTFLDAEDDRVTFFQPGKSATELDVHTPWEYQVTYVIGEKTPAKEEPRTLTVDDFVEEIQALNKQYIADFAQIIVKYKSVRDGK